MKENIKNKEDFGLQVIDYFTEYFSLSCKDILEDAAQSPLEKIRQILQRFI